MIEAIIAQYKDVEKEILTLKNHIDNEDLMVMKDLSHIETDHFIAVTYLNGDAIGFGSMTNGPIYQLDSLFVVEQERRNSYGDLMIKMLIDKAFRLDADEVLCLLPENMVPMMTRIGFMRKDSCKQDGVFYIKSDMIKKCK